MLDDANDDQQISQYGGDDYEAHEHPFDDERKYVNVNGAVRWELGRAVGEISNGVGGCVVDVGIVEAVEQDGGARHI